MLTGHGDAERVLHSLYRGHYFTERSDTAEPVYRYHDLFRAFLAQRAGQALGADHWRSVRLRAARILEARGEVDAAADLLQQAGDWARLAAIVGARAGSLLGRGRWRTVLNWLEGMPEAELRANPWLVYWKGMARAATDGPGGRALLETAAQAFAAAGELRGEALACAAIVDSYFQEWNTVAALDGWLARLERLLSTDAMAEDTLRRRALSSMVLALLYRQPAHPHLGDYVREIEQGLPQIDDVNERLSTAAYLLDYFTLSGRFDAVPAVVAQTEADARSLDALPGNTYLWWQRRGMYGYCSGDFEQARAGLGTALRIARDNGMVDAEFSALLLSGMLMASIGDTDQAATLLREMRAKLNPKRHMHAQGYHYLDLWLAVLCQDLARARRIWETFSKAPLLGVPTHAAHNHPIAWLLEREGAGDILLERVKRWRAALDGMRSPLMAFNLLAMEVCAYRAVGDEQAAVAALEEMFAIGAQRRYRSTLTWIPEMMSGLCALAIERGIQPAYVRWLILQRNLQPPHDDLPDWPRGIEVRTLGAFTILRNGETLEFSHKAPRKPLALLKAIIAEGERGLTTGAAHERLWLDQDGDAAAEALGAALHRLRRLLGRPEAVRLSDGRLMLDPALVWVDAFAFERLSQGSSADSGRRALSLYRGGFLPDDDAAPWTVPARDRLRARFVRLVGEIGRDHEASGRLEEAIACYRRGIDADALAEPFYQGLMRCLQRQERCAEGVAVYRQLRRTLSLVLGVVPSPQSEQLGRTLLGQP
jgi:DNA-binding SARP family transcriptional activator